MISGVSHGNGFKGAIGYVTEQDEARVLDARGVTSERTAAAEMRAVAAQSEKVKKPVYHRWFRVPDGERLTDEQWLSVVDKAEQALGLEECQRVVVRHGDDHVHVVWNRVDPETCKAVKVSHDYAKVEQVCREAEREYGLTVVPGHHSWKRAGAEHPPAAREATPAEQNQEARTGREPFARIVADAGAQAFRDAQSWRDLSDRLQRAGLSLQPYRQGLTVTDGTERAGLSSVTGNEWTRAKLEKRFGQTWTDFQEAPQQVQDRTATAAPAAPLRERHRRPDAEQLRAQYQDYRERFTRTVGQEARTSRYDAAWRGEQGKRSQEATARVEEMRRRKAIARAVFGRGFARKAAYKFIDGRYEKRKLEDRAQARARWDNARAAVSATRDTNIKPADYKTWLGQEAQAGNEAARRQLTWIGKKEARATTQAATPAEQAQARQDRALPDHSVSAEWKRLVDAQAAQLRAQAERYLTDTATKRQSAALQLSQHEKQRPTSPGGLAALVPGAQARYEAALKDWQTQRSRVEKGFGDLVSVEHKLKVFLGREQGYAGDDTVFARANREVREQRPDLAARMDTIRQRELAEARTQNAAKQGQIEKRREELRERYSKQLQNERDGHCKGRSR